MRESVEPHNRKCASCGTTEHQIIARQVQLTLLRNGEVSKYFNPFVQVDATQHPNPYGVCYRCAALWQTGIMNAKQEADFYVCFNLGLLDAMTRSLNRKGGLRQSVVSAGWTAMTDAPSAVIVEDWSASLKFNAFCNGTWNRRLGLRLDIWFIYETYYWHGVRYGYKETPVHFRQTKERHYGKIPGGNRTRS